MTLLTIQTVHSQQVAVTVDANSAVDDFNIGNNATTGGSLQLKEGTNNGSHHVQLKAPNSLSGNVAFTLPSADGSSRVS